MKISMQFFAKNGRKMRYGGGVPATIYGGNSIISRADIVDVAEARGFEVVPTNEFIRSSSSDDPNIGKRFVLSQEGTPFGSYNPAYSNSGESVDFVETVYEGNGRFRPTGEGTLINILNEGSKTIVFKRKRK